MNKNSKNLVILGFCSVAIAIVSSSVSLIVYHDSGDIYLDRSRPGFLPDETDPKPIVSDHSYTFSEEQGTITDEEIDEYLIELEEMQKQLDAVPNPYSSTSISDEALKIPTK